MNDLRVALRQIRKQPGLTAVCILTLALGIGANTAIFGYVDRLLVRPLPVERPDQLAMLAVADDRGPRYSFNYPLFTEYRERNQVFTHLVAQAQRSFGLGTDAAGTAERVRGLLVSRDYFEMLRLPAALGRTFAVDEGRTSGDRPVLVIGHGLWQRRFGSDPAVIGRSVQLNGLPFTVIGVTPREFPGTQLGTVADLYVPIPMLSRLFPPESEDLRADPLNSPFITWHEVLGRLKPGMAREEAQQSLRVLAAQLAAGNPNASTNLLVLSGAQGVAQGIREARLPLLLMLGVVALVLVIACANVAALQLARGSTRHREMAVRLALGASRPRIVRQLLVESGLLTFAGGAAGIVVAAWLSRALTAFRPSQVTVEDLAAFGRLDWRILVFGLTITVLTGVLTGLAPALQASRPDLIAALKGIGTAAGSTRRGGARRFLVAGQFALATFCAAISLLCVQSVARLVALDPGFEPSRVMAANLDLRLGNHRPTGAEAFFDRVLDRFRALPGIESVALASTTPLSGSSVQMSVERLEDYTPSPGEFPVFHVTVITPGYFRTLGMRLLQGRDFDETDLARAPRRAVINESAARRYWPDRNPIGRRIYQRGFGEAADETSYEIVGVVGDAPQRPLGRPVEPAMYRALAQHPQSGMTLLIRTAGPPAGLGNEIRKVIAELAPGLPVFGIRTLAEQRNGSVALPRMVATVLTGFGGLGMFLAALGLHGLLAFAVARRAREIGVRMALGAGLGDVLRLILGDGLRLVVAGGIVGMALALAGGRALRGFLYQVSPGDPVTLALVVALLGLVGMAASWLPARRAAAVDPMTALRQE